MSTMQNKAQFQALGAQEPTMLEYRQDAPALESAEEIANKPRRVAADVVRLLSRAST
jgi:hypothetical protein